MLTIAKNNTKITVTSNKEESIQAVNKLLSLYGYVPLTKLEMKDLNIRGGETENELEDMLDDYLGVPSSESAVMKNKWNFPN